MVARALGWIGSVSRINLCQHLLLNAFRRSPGHNTPRLNWLHTHSLVNDGIRVSSGDRREHPLKETKGEISSVRTKDQVELSSKGLNCISDSRKGLCRSQATSMFANSVNENKQLWLPLLQGHVQSFSIAYSDGTIDILYSK